VLPLSQARREEIERRLAAHDAAPENALTWEEVLDRLKVDP
jgi:putative addiction module component (TIGR02574 family)